MTLLEEADSIVNGERARSYGHPADNHACTAALWTAFLRRKYGVSDLALTAEDVCWLNILQKVSREANCPKKDNVLDVVGYALNLDMVQERNRNTKATTPQ
jgi:hypothetical protein